MKEKTYRRMTKKCSLRGLKLFKQKYLTKQRFYALLAKIRLVREVKTHTSKPIINNEYINRVRLLEHKITTDRGVFNLSFFCRGERHSYAHWYESIFSHKILYKVIHEGSVYVETEVRSECEEFEVRLNPFHSQRVNRSSPHIAVFGRLPKIEVLTATEPATAKMEVTTVNFLKARLGTKVTLKVVDCESIEDAVKESVQKATVQIRNYIEGNPAEINEKLVGVKYDGEFCTKDGKKLLANNICCKCGSPVFESSVEGYTAQCLLCDEDLYSIEVSKVDPKTYKEIYEYNKETLQKILTE